MVFMSSGQHARAGHAYTQVLPYTQPVIYRACTTTTMRHAMPRKRVRTTERKTDASGRGSATGDTEGGGGGGGSSEVVGVGEHEGSGSARSGRLHAIPHVERSAQPRTWSVRTRVRGIASHLECSTGRRHHLAEQEGAPWGEPGTRTAPCRTGGLRAFAHTTRHDTLPALLEALR